MKRKVRMQPEVLIMVGGLVPFQNQKTRKQVVFKNAVDPLFQHKGNFLTKRIGHGMRIGLFLKYCVRFRHVRTLICFDSSVAIGMPRLAKLFYPNARKIVYMRNHIENEQQKVFIQHLRAKGYEIWSYHKEDCIQFDMRYNPQVLDRSLFHKNEYSTNQYDAVFLGNTKGREKQLQELEQELNGLGLNTCFYVHKYMSKNDRQCKEQDRYRERLLPYRSYIGLIRASRAVIDLMNQNNWGMSIRPIEAMYLEKKLITNYKDIVKYDFYHPDNIFILNGDNVEQIPAWLKKPYHPVPEEIVEQYDIDKWLERFFINGEYK